MILIRKENKETVDKLCEELEELEKEKNDIEKYEYFEKSHKIFKELNKYKLSPFDQKKVKIGLKVSKTGLKINKGIGKAISRITQTRLRIIEKSKK